MPKTTPSCDLVPKNSDAFLELVRRAEQGDRTTLPTIREMLKNPTTVDRVGGDLARQAELSLIEAVGGKNLLFKEGLSRKLDLLRAELAGPNPTPVERLLIERVVTCWLQVQVADVRLAQQGSTFSLKQGEHHERCRDRAHRRYLSALKTLAVVRRLALPVLLAQVNVARNQQVNVATLPPQPAGE